MKNEMEQFAKMSATKNKGVTEECLQETEQLLAVVIDEQYKALVKLVNAAEYGEWCFYPIKDKRNLKKTFDDVVRNTQLKRAEKLPPQFFAIAENGTGNFLCMKSDESAIYHQNHEQESPEKFFSDLKEFITHAEEFET